MNGARRTAVTQILHAIENGKLPADETQRRLITLIQKETARTDGPADEELISACLDLMERLQGREHVEDEARISALNHRITAAIEKKKISQKRWKIAFRSVGAIAAAVVLLIGIGIPLRWRWFESWSTPDAQQHIIMGHEISVDMIETAIAGQDTNSITIIDEFSQLNEIIGLDINLPERLGEEWIIQLVHIDYPKGYIKVMAKYESLVDPSRAITCTICLYTDMEYAYFAFEQSREGKLISINDIKLYVSNNVERASTYWYNKCLHVRVAGNVSMNEITDLTLSIIGGKNE